MDINFDNIIPINKDLRNYQITAKEDIYKAWKTFRTVMFQMPTGTGKTRLFSSIIKDLHDYGAKIRKPVKILILAHREELISQISESIGEKYGIAHGKIKSRHDEEPHFPTQVASVQTLYRRIDRWIRKDFDIIIIDEAHHVLAKTYKDICNKFPNAKLLGVTATPYRLNAEPFPPFFDVLVQSKSIYQFIKEGFLCDYEYYSIKPTSFTQQLINTIPRDFSGDYDEQEMIKLLDNKKIRANIFETYEKYAKGKKGIVYTINKAHNQHVYEIYKQNGYSTAVIDSETPPDKRKGIVQQFKSGGITILCNVNIFSEGFDCPDVEFIQLARPTLSLSMYLQQVGRGFRIHDEKEKVIFLDNVGLFNRFGLPSANRKWQFYFEGKHKGIEINHLEENQTIKEKKQISEGVEEVELLYDSSQVQIEPNELFWEREKRQNIHLIQENKDKEILKIIERMQINEQFIPQLQNFLWNLKEKYIFQNDYNFSISYDKNNEFKIIFDNQTYEAAKLEHNELNDSPSALKKSKPDKIEVKLDTNKSFKVRPENVTSERKAFIIQLIKEAKYTRKELLNLLNDKFGADDPHGSHPHNNLLSEIKNPKYFAKHGLGVLVEENKNGIYQFVTELNKGQGFKPGDQVEFEINNSTKLNESKAKISVTFLDKTVIDYENVTKTYIEVFKKIGLIKIQSLDIKYAGVPLVTDREYNTYHLKKNVDKFWILIPMSTKQKISYLEEINRRLALRLKIKTF
jgi:superfamily II DNA or RNA helicase